MLWENSSVAVVAAVVAVVAAVVATAVHAHRVRSDGKEGRAGAERVVVAAGVALWRVR